MKKYLLVALLLFSGLYSAVAQCTADAGPEFILTCNTTEVVLQGSSNAPNATYAWSGPGGFTSTQQNPEVNIPGVYSLTITDPSDGCTATAGTEVVQNITPPQLFASGGVLTCTITSINLNIATSPQNTPWICTGPQNFTWPAQAVVTQPGVYTIIATNSGNGCTTSTTVVVNMDVISPVATATGGALSCVQPVLTLSGAGSSIGPLFNYTWTTSNGNFVSGTNTLNPVVNAPGTYILMVTNTANGCTATAQAIVTQNGTSPDVTASGGTVGCTPANITLSASSNTPGATFVWSGPNNFNSFLQNPVLLNATSLQAGAYTVTVTNTVNGCTATATAVVALGSDVPRATAAITSPNCNGDATGSIVVTASGGIPPYTYVWTGPGGFASGSKDIVGVPAGIYALTISDGTGCSNVQSFNISQPAPLVLTANITPVSCFGGSNGSIAIEISGGNGGGTFAYLWSTGSTSSMLFGLPVGTYTVTVVDINNCTATLPVQLTQPAQLVVTGITACETSTNAQVTGGTPPYLYSWRLGSPNGQVMATGPNPQNLIPGLYYLVVFDAKDCTVVSAPFTFGANTTPCTRITGRIILDENINCAEDPQEQALGNRFVQASGVNGTFYGISDTSGEYTVTVAPGDYVLSFVVKNAQTVVCQNDIAVSLPQQGDTEQVDFLVQVPDPECPALSVNITTSALRRCFNTNYYYIQYCNDGPGTALNAYIDFDLDPLMFVINTSKPFTNLGNNQFRFHLGDLAPNDCGNFWIRTEISCEAVLGQTHCSEAHIYPDSSCNPVDPLWSGALLQVSSRCDGDSLRFILKNTGTAPMSELLEYIVIEDGTMGLQGGSPPLAAGDSMIVSVPATGATWHIEAKQEPFAPPAPLPERSVEGCVTSGTFNLGYINQFTLGDDVPWIDENCTPNTGAYDPNDKQGFPTGFGAKHYIRPGTELEYLIRFQNTGTDTAFTSSSATPCPNGSIRSRSGPAQAATPTV
jgi:hypothetical protein